MFCGGIKLIGVFFIVFEFCGFDSYYIFFYYYDWWELLIGVFGGFLNCLFFENILYFKINLIFEWIENYDVYFMCEF